MGTQTVSYSITLRMCVLEVEEGIYIYITERKREGESARDPKDLKGLQPLLLTN